MAAARTAPGDPETAHMHKTHDVISTFSADAEGLQCLKIVTQCGTGSYSRASYSNGYTFVALPYPAIRIC